MKSKEELAIEWATGIWEKEIEPGASGDLVPNEFNWDTWAKFSGPVFTAGFDAGFQRAVEMLREPKSTQSHREYGESHLRWADWLESQLALVPSESGGDDGS